MNDRLPGIAITGSAPVAAPLERAGMQGIDLPLRFADGSAGHAVQAIAGARWTCRLPASRASTCRA